MARISGENSTYTILTSDNPRTEDPERIIDEVEVGIKDMNVPYERVADRKEAIRRAMLMAKAGDVVLLAGKGHEDYQIIGHEKIHLSDIEEVKKYL
jgi:UDP-N-acetylmuramoyl-L-alanyl-D-glutamate--2,6-diaminopimelate ligase